MASPKLTQEQQEINSILHEAGYLTFTVEDYSKNSKAITLLEKYKARNNSMMGKENFRLYMHGALQDRRNSKQFKNLDNSTQFHAVQVFFGLKHKPLICKLLSIEYENALTTSEDGIQAFDTELNNKRKYWIHTCHSIDRCFKQYEEDQHIWMKSADAKKEYKKCWKQIADSQLFQYEQESLIHTYVSFLENNYGLNQKTKAKADILLSLKFPNVNTLTIAKQIVQNSSLIK